MGVGQFYPPNFTFFSAPLLGDFLYIVCLQDQCEISFIALLNHDESHILGTMTVQE